MKVRELIQKLQEWEPELSVRLEFSVMEERVSFAPGRLDRVDMELVISTREEKEEE